MSSRRVIPMQSLTVETGRCDSQISYFAVAVTVGFFVVVVVVVVLLLLV